MPGAHMVLDAFGASWRLDLTTLDDADRALLHRLWEWAVVPPRGDEVDYVVTCDPEALQARAGTLVHPGPGLPYDLSRGLTRASIGRRAGDCLLVHAAGLADDDGRVVGLAAASGSGKTTAAVQLGRHFRYVTDETLCVETDGSVTAYPKPLSVIDETGRTHKLEHSPAELGLRRADGPLRLHTIVMLERDPGAPEASLEPLPLLDTLLALIPQTSSVMLLPRPLQRLAEVVTAAGGPYRLRYSEVAAARGPLEMLLTRGPGTRHWEGEDGRRMPHVEPWSGRALGRRTRVGRATWLDAVHDYGETLLVLDSAPIHLAGIGAIVWALAEEPVTLQVLTEAVVTVAGPHPDAAERVGAAVAQLLEAGALGVAR